MNSTEIATKLAPLTTRRVALSTRLGAIVVPGIMTREGSRIGLAAAGTAVPAKLNDEIRALRDEEAAITGALAQLAPEISDLETQLQRAQKAEAVASARQRLDAAAAAARQANARRRERFRQFMGQELPVLQAACNQAQDEGRAAAAALTDVSGIPSAFVVDRYSDGAEANFVTGLLGYGAEEWLRVGR
jgi:chromosome segregation ATPase